MIVRASEPEDIVHRAEIAELVEQRSGTLRELVGSRRDVQLDRHTLRQIAPDIARSDVYVCGPSGFNDGVIDVVRRLGVPGERIHVEEFSF